MMSMARILAAVLFAVSACTCSGGDRPAGPVVPVPTSINLSAGAITFSALGATRQLTATVIDQSGTPMSGISIEWSSADSKVATVTSGGMVTAARNGATAITARAGPATAVSTVTVHQVAASLSIGGGDRTVPLGKVVPLVAQVRDSNAHLVEDAEVSWSSTDSTIAAVDTSGVLTPRSEGLASILAQSGVTRDSIGVQVARVLVEQIPAALSTPAPGALWEIPVVIIRVIPTLDGTSVDSVEGAISGSLGSIRQRISVFEERIKFMLEEGSRFRGYQDSSAQPSLGYRVLQIVTVFSHFQRGKEVPWNPGHYFPDYFQILALVDARSWVNQEGVKEFWIWGYQSDNFEQPESNMSSPVTGDISNSSRFEDDLPVYDHTYTVYGYNFARTQAEAVHNHGHQLEAILSYRDPVLFWQEFVGRDASNTQYVTGRAGWTHMPPNTTVDYDYENPTVVQSDIADWMPGGGTTQGVSAATWGGVSYPWPAARVPGEVDLSQRVESQWYIYWMQSMPGRGNTISQGSQTMTNWWRFTGDWDGAIRDGQSLTTLGVQTITIRNDYSGDVSLSPGGSLHTGETTTLTSGAPMPVAVWDCGEAGGCKWDTYQLQPGKRYHVITDPAGPATNLTIAELT